MVLGLLAVVAGGYVTSWKSPDSKITNAAVFGFLQVLLGLTIAMFVAMPAWFNITSAILVIPAGLLGAYLAVRTR